jgi:transcriptional regulator with AAA-type ATPase domain
LEHGNAKKKFSKDVRTIAGIRLTGNIRELRNVVERLIILGGTKFPKMM